MKNEIRPSKGLLWFVGVTCGLYLLFGLVFLLATRGM